ncbi:kinesin-like protein KIN-7E [Silene latifolia]|uniref:kinesin-like protein KIN-7E n=1 Tax=Silene latifolia TaxID=37657 RepID=UPI003D7733C5
MVSVNGDQQVMRGSAQGSDARHEKICVSVRLRPLNEKEIQSNDFADWECINNTTILFKNVLGERSMYPNAYNFDRVYGNDCSTKTVYEEAAKEVALSVLNGINSSVFAYGQTSSGKTFTMSGITQYAVTDIYDYMEKHKEREFVVKFSAIEIYNENVRDLLSPDPSPLRCLDDPERGTVVERLIEEILEDRSHLLELIAVCEAQRQTGETCLNETSSRSHQILRLTIESSARQFGGGNSSMLTANVNFVDLAGSERTSQTLATGTRLKEGSHINRSLLTLGKVIRSLSKGRNGHVPYRDSKLTRILHNSLGGNARTAIICTMSPAHSHLEQTRNTLLFASCAKEVSTNARVNVVMSDKALVKQLKKELAKLESELKTISSVSKMSDVTSALKEKELQIQKMEKEMKEISRERDLAQSRVEELLQSTGRRQFSGQLDDASSSHYTSESRERISWPDDSSATSDASDYQRLDVDLTSSESFQYLDEHTDLESTAQQSDLLENYESLPEPLGHETVDVAASDDKSCPWEEDYCKEVRCIEVEEATVNRETRLSNPSMVFAPQVTEKEIGKAKDEEKMDVSEKKHIVPAEEMKGSETPYSEHEPLSTDKVRVMPVPAEEKEEHIILPEENEKDKEEVDQANADYEALVKRIKELQKTIDYLVNRDPVEFHSPSPMGSDKWSSKGLNLSRSRSCKAALSTIPAGPTFERMGKHHRDQSFGGFDLGAISERPKGLPRASDMKDGNIGNPSRLGFPTVTVAVRNEMEQDAVHSDLTDMSSIAETNEDAKDGSDDQLESENDCIIYEEPESKYSERNEHVRDVPSYGMKERDCMSDGTPSSLQTPVNWTEEFETTRFRIIQLWHGCHIPLVHRTYFYLLFKGDPSDKLYLEVELRRLSFIKNRFDQNQKIVIDGQIFTPSASMRALNQEREMLMKQIYKKIPVEERATLFANWGISMNSKLRRLQLARLLWSDNKDMQHIRESADLVAKLVGFVDDGQVPKEMFVGPSLTPRTILNRRSYSWK